MSSMDEFIEEVTDLVCIEEIPTEKTMAVLTAKLFEGAAVLNGQDQTTLANMMYNAAIALVRQYDLHGPGGCSVTKSEIMNNRLRAAVEREKSIVRHGG